MSREIKFRAWDGERMRESFLIHQANGMPCTIHGDVIETHHDWILEQYTGLKDKSGVEIYEGDVVIGWVLNPKGKHVVKFIADKYNCEFMAEDIDGKGKIHIWYEGIEVIGNIHQNPELLEE